MTLRCRFPRIPSGSGAILLAAAVTLTAPAAAQTIEPVVTDTFLVLVPYRPADEIRAELDRVRAERRSAEMERRRSEDLERRVDAQIEVQKREIELLKSREELAKREKREADREAERERRRHAELARTTLERRRALRGTESDVAKAEQESGEAREKALAAELELADKRTEYERLTGPAGSSAPDSARIARLARDISELERRTLQARADAASKERDYADRSRTLAERRLALFDAQRRLAGATR